MKSNKSISRKISCNFKNDQKCIFELGKLPKMQFHEEKKLIYWISRVFLPGIFLNFPARCAIWSISILRILEVPWSNTIGKGKLNNVFLHFLPYLWFIKVEHTKGVTKLWKIIKYGKKWRIDLFDLPSTHFLADSRYPKPKFRVLVSLLISKRLLP